MSNLGASGSSSAGSSSSGWMGITGGSSGTGGGSSASSGVTSATSSASSSSGAGGTAGAGTGGAGAATAASASTTGSTATTSAGNTSASSSSASSSGAPAATVLLLAGSPSSLLGGEFHPSTAWKTTTLAGSTSFGTSLTMDGASRGVGAYTSATGDVVSATVWSGGAWSVPASIAAGAVAREQPFLDAAGGATTHLVYQDSTFSYWYLAFTGTWSAPQAVGTATNPSYGPGPATIAARGANATAAFIDGQAPAVNDAAASDLQGGAWTPRADLAASTNFNVSPAIVPLSAGPELMMIYVASNAKITFLTRTSGTWSTALSIANALTDGRVALAPLPEGAAILAFRGQDTNLYWSLYAGGAWSVVAPFSTPNVSVDVPPALTHGVGDATAEIAYVSGGSAYHARLSTGAWSAPVLVGGTGLNGVAIASAP